MIRQSLAFDDILEKKFKILRTSIMLGNFKNDSLISIGNIWTIEDFNQFISFVDDIGKQLSIKI